MTYFWILLGGIAALVGRYFLAKLLHVEQRPRKRLRCIPTYCADLLAGGADQFGEDVVIRVGSEQLIQPVIFNYYLESTGNQTINNCQIQVRSAEVDLIIRAQVLVQNELQCERIKWLWESPNSRKMMWSHINPGDSIIIVLLLSPCTNPESVRLEADADGLELDELPLQVDCSPFLPCDMVDAVTQKIEQSEGKHDATN